jgi:bacteriorhodopsin
MSLYTNDTSPIEIPTPNIGLMPTQPSTELTKDIAKSSKKDAIITQKLNPINPYVKFSFMITNILLLTTATVTLIEALRTDIPSVRHILNLETCISLVAGYFYSVFLAQIQESEKLDKPIDWSEITQTRYVDWSITTPIMLLILCVVLSARCKKEVMLHTVLYVIGLNYAMLFIGFMGEMGNIGKITACILGFIPFLALFYIIYVNFVKGLKNFSESFLYYFYLVVWSLYGLVFLLNESAKNIAMNILDCITKVFVGIGLFVYYSGIIKGW